MLVMVDRFTKCTFLMKLPQNATSQLVATTICRHIVREQNLRVMAEIVADHDPLFTSKIAPHMGRSLWPRLSIART